MSRLNRSLDELASRGRPRGALDIFAAAGAETPVLTPDKPKVTRPWAAFAGGFAGVLVIGIVASLVLSNSGTDSTDGPGVLQDNGVILLVGGNARGWEDALVYGRLIVGEGGCLSLRFEGNGTTHPVVWPSGTRFATQEGRAIEVPGAGTIPVGAVVIAGGGYLTVPSDDLRLPDVPQSCLVSGSEVALVAPGSVRLEPTTTTMFTMPPDLPPASQTAITVPAGSDLEWFDFMPGSVQLAWRESGDGAELCWRTIEAEECLDDGFRSPEVVVIPTHFTQFVVITRPPLVGAAPDRVLLELSDGQTMDVPLSQHGSVGLLYGTSSRIDGATVTSANADTFPPVSCATPPASALDVSESAFEIRVSPAQIRRGDIVELFIGSGPDTITGVPTFWQCWDGSEWIYTHVGFKSTPDSDVGPTVVRWESNPFWVLVGLEVPQTFPILVPDLPPGLYRIEDQVGTEKGWVIVEVVG